MKILFIGEIVAGPGRKIVKEYLSEIRNQYNPDLIITNIENLVNGKGATIEKINELQELGVRLFTGGDHIFWNQDLVRNIDSVLLARPSNYPIGTPGVGHLIYKINNKRLLLINLMGRTSFGGPMIYLDDPFRKLDKILEDEHGNYDFSLLDFHAEATSEKYAMGFYADGRVDAVVGTHTHVPTCDHRVLPKGTVYITDVGMTGNIDSVLGVKKDIILQVFLTAQNQKFEWAKSGKKAFRSVIIDIQNRSIERVDRVL